NAARQDVARIAIDECRPAATTASKKIEAWAGITAPKRADTLANLIHAIEIEADAAVVAPLSIGDVSHPPDFVDRYIVSVFDRAGRMIPVVLSDNAAMAAPAGLSHLHTRDVKT